MKKAYILVGVLLYSILGCSAGKKHVPGAEGLSDSELRTVKAVNRLQGLALDLAHGAGGSSTPDEKLTDTPEEKGVVLTKMIKDGNCAQTYQKPSDQYDVSWQAGWTVTSASCPITVNELTAYQYSKIVDRKGTKVTGELSFQRMFNMQPEFQNVLGLSPLGIHGKLNRGLKANGTYEVSGAFTYDEFEATNIGKVNANISVVPLEGGGSILLKLTISRSSDSSEDIVANLEMRWDGKGRSYILNGGKDMSREAFLELFSSFELLELLDRIQKMM